MARREEVLNRRKEVAQLYLKGWFQADIAEKYGVSRQAVTQDLQVIYRMWRQSAVRDFDQLKERELIKIDNLERTYWEAWEESKTTFEKERKKYQNAKLSEMQKEKIYQFGDSRYLSGIQWCINKRCAILGIDAPAKSDVTIKNEQPLFPDVSENDSN